MSRPLSLALSGASQRKHRPPSARARLACAAALALAAFAPARSALADEGLKDMVEPNPAGTRFGSRGQTVLSSDFSFSFEHTSRKFPDGGDSSSKNDLLLRPSVDYFVGNNVSLGVNAGFERTWGDDDHETRFGLGPKLGVNAPLGEALSFWPQLSLTFQLRTAGGSGGGDDPTLTQLELGLFAPLLFHPARHFFLGLGPSFSTHVWSSVSSSGSSSDGPKDTTIGVVSQIGGYF